MADDEAVHAVVYIKGGARAWSILLPRLEQDYKTVFCGASLVGGEFDIAAHFCGTREAIGNAVLDLKRQKMGRSVKVNGHTLRARPPARVVPRLIEPIDLPEVPPERRDPWADPRPQNDSTAFVEIDIEWPHGLIEHADEHIAIVVDELKTMVPKIDYLARVKGHHCLFVHLSTATSTEFDEFVLNKLQMHHLVESTKTMFVMNPPPPLRADRADELLEEASKAPLDTFVTISMGHLTTEEVAGHLSHLFPTNTTDLASAQAEFLYAHPDVLVKLPERAPGKGAWGAAVFRLLTEGFAETSKMPASVDAFQARRVHSESTDREIRAYLDIEVRHPLTNKKTLAKSLLEKEKPNFEYLAEVPNQPRLVAIAAANSKSELDELVMDRLRRGHAKFVLGTSTQIILQRATRQDLATIEPTPAARAVLIDAGQAGYDRDEFKKALDAYCKAKNAAAITKSSFRALLSRARRGEIDIEAFDAGGKERFRLKRFGHASGVP